MATRNSLVFDFLARDRASKTMQGIGGKLGKLGGKIAAFAKTAALAAAAAAAAFGVKAVQGFLAFDDKMNQSLAIMGEISGPMRQRMEEAAREVGKTTRFSAAEAAEAYFFLASAGLDAKASVAAMPQVAKFATAGMFDLATATDLATDAQSALGLAVDDPRKNLKNLTRVTDVLVKANTLANASVEQFSTSLTRKAGAALRAVGKDVEEGVAALALFADQGVKGELAGTMLATTLDGLAKSAIKNKDEFSKFNIEVFDSDGKMRNLAAITKDMEKSLGGLSDKEQIAALTKLGFNKQALDAIRLLIGNSEALTEYEKQLGKAAGTVDEVANKQLQSFQAKWELLKSKVDDFGLTVGEFLVTKLLALADAAGPVIERISIAFNKLRTHMQGLDLGAVSIENVTGLVRDFGSTLAGIFAKIPFEELGQAFAGLFRTVSSVIRQLMPTLRQIGSNIAEVLGPALGEIGRILADDVIPALRGFLTAATPIAKFVLEILGGAVVGVLKGVIDFIKGALKIISGIFNVFAGVLTGDWSKVWKGIKQILVGAWDAIKGIVRIALNVGILKVFRVGFNILKKIVTGAWNFIKKIFRGSIKAVTGTVDRGAGVVVRFFRRMVARARAVLSRIVAVVTRPFRRGFNRLKNAVKNGVNRVVKFVRRLPNRIKRIFRAAPRMLLRAGKNIITGLWNGLKQKIGQVISWFRSKIAAIRDMFPFSPAKTGPLSGRGSPDIAGQKIITMLADGMRKQAPQLTRVMTDTLEPLAADQTRIRPPTLTPGVTGMAGDPRRVVIEIRGDGSKRADFLVDELRHAVRVRGGDVQTVIGRGGRR